MFHPFPFAVSVLWLWKKETCTKANTEEGLLHQQISLNSKMKWYKTPPKQQFTYFKFSTVIHWKLRTFSHEMLTLPCRNVNFTENQVMRKKNLIFQTVGVSLLRKYKCLIALFSMEKNIFSPNMEGEEILNQRNELCCFKLATFRAFLHKSR